MAATCPCSGDPDDGRQPEVTGAPALRRTAVVPVGGDDIAYEVAGPEQPGGEVVGLIHGSGGNRATWWPVVPGLAAAHTVVSLDVRGSGRSSDRAQALGPHQVAADLEAIREAEGIERWHVV